MEIAKTATWTLKNGQTAECKITVVRKMVEDIVYADGWNIPNGTKPVEFLDIIITLSGKVVAMSNTEPSIIKTPIYSKEYADKMIAAGGYAKVGDNGVISKEAYDKIMTALTEAIAEAEQDIEYAAYIANCKPAPEIKYEATDPNLCPICGTYCYGDCQANERRM